MAKHRVFLTRRWPEAVEARLAEAFDLDFNEADRPLSETELAEAMGIAVAAETTGADSGTMIDAGDWAAVERHNISDVETLRAIYKRMNA